MTNHTDYEKRLKALEEFCESQGWEVRTWTGNQREPGIGLSIREIPGVRAVVFETSDSDPMVPLARAEQFLTAMKRAASHAYLHDPHSHMGRL